MVHQIEVLGVRNSNDSIEDLDIFFMVLETKVCLVFKTFIDPYCVLIDELLNFK